MFKLANRSDRVRFRPAHTTPQRRSRRSEMMRPQQGEVLPEPKREWPWLGSHSRRQCPPGLCSVSVSEAFSYLPRRLVEHLLSPLVRDDSSLLREGGPTLA